MRTLWAVLALVVTGCATVPYTEQPLHLVVANHNWYANKLTLYCESGKILSPVLRGLTMGRTRTQEFRYECPAVWFRVEGLGGREWRSWPISIGPGDTLRVTVNPGAAVLSWSVR